MDKTAIYAYFKSQDINYEPVEHAAVYNMEEMSQIDLPHPEADAKNIFVRDDKKANYYLITVKGDKRINLKEFRKQHVLRNLSFASEQDLMDILGLIPGAVTPLGMLNDETCKVQFYLDRDFLDEPGLIGIHPNDNTATVYLQTADLVTIVKNHGNTVEIVEI